MHDMQSHNIHHERACVLDPKVPFAFAPFDGDAGNLLVFLFGVPPFPFALSASVFAATIYYLISVLSLV